MAKLARESAEARDAEEAATWRRMTFAGKHDLFHTDAARYARLRDAADRVR